MRRAAALAPERAGCETTAAVLHAIAKACGEGIATLPTDYGELLGFCPVKTLLGRQSTFMTTESTSSGSVKRARSPALLPGTRNSRAERGLRSRVANAATSRS